MKLLCDAHTHFVTEEDLKERKEKGIVSLFSHTDPNEVEAFLKKDLPPHLIPTCGIHPWSADKIALTDMRPYLEKVPVIGEIGMDNVWCDVPLSIQEKVFEEQLELAAALKKPVTLHTKGQEKEIAALIKKYPNRYLVHWYSCMEHLDLYMEEDCFFSIGPDVFWNPATQNVARNVSIDRILTETDGLSAVQWAFDEAPSSLKKELPIMPDSTEKALHLVIETTAKLRNLNSNDFQTIAYENLTEKFLK